MNISQFFILLANLYLASAIQSIKAKNITFIIYISLALIYLALGK